MVQISVRRALKMPPGSFSSGARSDALGPVRPLPAAGNQRG
jgi:hypothetical protein